MAGVAAGHGDRAGVPHVVRVLAAGSLVNSSASFVVPFLVLYLVHRGYSVSEAAGAVSAYAAGKIAAGPVGGRLTDRAGARVTIVGSMAGSALATMALAMTGGPAVTTAVAAVTGLATELYRPAVSAYLAAVPGPQRVKAFGIYQVGVSAGTTAGPAIGGLVAEHSFLLLFAGDAATSLAWAILAWRLLPAGRPAPAQAAPHPQARHGVLGDRRMARLLAVTVLANLVLFQAQTTLPLWVHRQGLPTATYGLLLALNSALVVAMQLPAARLAGRWRPEPVIATACVIIGAGFTLLAVAHTVILLAAAVAVWSLGELAQWPVAAAYTTRLAPPGMTGRYAGARSFCYGLALLLAPLSGTALYHRSPAALWALCGVAGLCAAAIITPWPAAGQLATRQIRGLNGRARARRSGSRSPRAPRPAWSGRTAIDGPPGPARCSPARRTRGL